MGKGIFVAVGLGVVVVLLWVRFVGSGARGRAMEPTSSDAPRDESGAPRDAELAAPPTFAEDERASPSRELAPDAVLVHVRDPRDRPIADALVRRWLGEQASDLRTEADGACVLPGARDAMLDLELSAAGFAGWRAEFRPGARLELELVPAIRILGTVVDAATGLPIPGARVHVRRRSRWMPQVEDAVADASGAFQLEGVPDVEALHLCASAEGYPELSAGVPRQARADIELALEAGPTIEVQVLEFPGDRPVAGAEVSELCTDADGRVHVKGGAAGETVHMYAAAPGFAWAFGSARGGTPAKPLLVRLPRLARLEGFVRDEQGNLAAGAEIRFEPEDEASVHASAFPALPAGWQHSVPDPEPVKSDERGHYVSGGLLPGVRCAVEAEHPQAGEVFTSAGPLGGPGTTARLDLALVRPPRGTVTGRVRFNGNWLPGSVRWRAGPSSGESNVDLDSVYRLERVPAGTVTLSLDSDLRRLGEILQGTEATVHVEDGGTTRHDFVLTLPFADVGGRVTHADGRTVGKGARLSIRHEKYSKLGKTASSGDWSESVPDVGWEYDVELDHGDERLRVSGVRAGDTRVDFVVPELVTLPLVVLDAATEEPVERWRLLSSRDGGPKVWHEATGLLRLAPGTHELVIETAPVSGYVAERVVVELVAGEKRAPLEIRMQRGLELDVELVADPGPAGERLVLRLEREPPLEQRTLEFGADRHATARALRPGTWRIQAPEGVVFEPDSVTVPFDGTLRVRWDRKE